MLSIIFTFIDWHTKSVDKTNVWRMSYYIKLCFNPNRAYIFTPMFLPLPTTHLPVDISDIPPKIMRIDPQNECWQIADRLVAIEWDRTLINFTLINIEVLSKSLNNSFQKRVYFAWSGPHYSKVAILKWTLQLEWQLPWQQIDFCFLIGYMIKVAILADFLNAQQTICD